MEEQCSSGRMPRGEESMTCADGPYTVLSRIYDEGEIILKLQQGYPFSHTLANSERAQLSDCYSFHSVVEA